MLTFCNFLKMIESEIVRGSIELRSYLSVLQPATYALLFAEAFTPKGHSLDHCSSPHSCL